MPEQFLMDFDFALNEAYKHLDEQSIKLGLDCLLSCLNDARKASSRKEWKEQLVPKCRENGLAQMLYQDPFTRRSAEKPRGYPGDAMLIDFIYGNGDAQRKLDNVTELGRLAWLCQNNG